ncbi:MAG: hypothetical protein KME03_20335 [Aphanocapsa lilacina HA4352-LM1]|jgi:hypothetical protein|nr:hypothetical protein [Aphanocapsa lilacina HA4352-LM1]
MAAHGCEDALKKLLDVRTIYYEPAVLDHPRGRHIFERSDLKRGWVAQFRELLARRLPYCRVRYAF